MRPRDIGAERIGRGTRPVSEATQQAQRRCFGEERAETETCAQPELTHPLESLDGAIDLRSFAELEFSEDLLAGALDVASAPVELVEVGRLVRRAQAPGEARELAGERVVVAAMVRAFHEGEGLHIEGAHIVGVAPARRSRRVGRRIALLGVAGALTMSGAAAATGSLPGPARSVFARSLSQVGISLPGAERTVTVPQPEERGGHDTHAGGVGDVETGTDRAGEVSAADGGPPSSAADGSVPPGETPGASGDDGHGPETTQAPGDQRADAPGSPDDSGGGANGQGASHADEHAADAVSGQPADDPPAADPSPPSAAPPTPPAAAAPAASLPAKARP